MNRVNLLDALTARLSQAFSGYSLMNKQHELQQVRVFAQYVPRSDLVSYSQQDSTQDEESNIPLIIAKLDTMTDFEQGRHEHSTINARILCAVFDDDNAAQAYRDILDMQDIIRQNLLENRVICKRYILKMPLKSQLLDVETWPIYWGEQQLIFEAGRPLPGWDWVHGGMRPQELDTINRRD